MHRDVVIRTVADEQHPPAASLLNERVIESCGMDERRCWNEHQRGSHDGEAGIAPDTVHPEPWKCSEHQSHGSRACDRATKMTVRVMLANQSMSTNAVITLPAMLPAVEMAAIDPAVEPLWPVVVVKSRTAIGEMEANKSVGSAKSRLVVMKACVAKSSPDVAMRGESNASSQGTPRSVAAALNSAAMRVFARGQLLPARPPPPNSRCSSRQGIPRSQR